MWKRKITIISVVLSVLVLSVGCPSPPASNQPVPTIPDNPPSGNGNIVDAVTPVFDIDPDKAPPVDNFWIRPAEIIIGNLPVPSEVSTLGSGEPVGIQVHNGGRTQEGKIVTNSYNDPSVVITLKDYLYEIPETTAIYWNLIDDPETKEVETARATLLGGRYYLVDVYSELSNETLKVTNYDRTQKQITVYGLIDPSGSDTIRQRTVSVSYVGTEPKQFRVYFVFPTGLVGEWGYPPLNVGDWVVISEPIVTLDTWETVVVPIAMYIPENANIPNDKWEMWFKVGEYSSSQGGVTLQIEYRCRWRITMTTGG